MADLVITGVGLPTASIRGVTQSLAPIDAASRTARTVNGALIDVSAPQFRKFRSTIECTDQNTPELSDVWPGQIVTVDCIAHLAGTPIRPVVESWVDGAFTFYRPRLTMRVLSYNVEHNEFDAVVGWTLELEEV